MRVPERTGRINQLADPARLLRERNLARSALAEVLRATYDDEMPDRIADNLRAIVLAGTRISDAGSVALREGGQ